MFDRRKSDRAEGANCAVITLADGRELKGKFNVPPGRTLTEMLSGASNFMEFEPFGGDLMLIAKSAMQTVKPINVPNAPNLSAGTRETDAFDPYAILRIDRDAGAEDVRKAFLDLAKTYHPDKYATVELPAEVRAHLAAMSRRVNAAHDAVQETLKARAARQEPIFTKTG
jgi:hypothetical protein